MKDWESAEFYERNREPALKDIAAALKKGELSLMLGAGCSAPMHLPTWPDLARSCCKEVATKGIKVECDDITDDWPGEKLFMRMATARRLLNNDADFLAIVRRNLYGPWGGKAPSEPTQLLRAIGTMTMGSKRGRVREIITLNFDSLIEWYLTFHGYVVQVIEDVPKIHREADVTIYHPHGYLPFDGSLGQPSKTLIFDQEAVEERMLAIQAAWNETFRFLLGSRVFLAVGLSGNDSLHRLLLRSAADQRRKGDDRPLGFWFYRETDEKKFDSDVLGDLRAKGIAMLKVAEFVEIEKFLLDVCREAAGSVIF